MVAGLIDQVVDHPCIKHETLTTTQAYIAVYDNEVIDHHRAFIARRRGTRPSEEYREPTEAEWDEFLGHFERRKVELGVCGRAYGTPCLHEHACIRCPMLRPDPGQVTRLTEIIENLTARLTEAHEHGWFGEVDGLEVSLSAAGKKLAAMRRMSGHNPVPVQLVARSTPAHLRGRWNDPSKAGRGLLRNDGSSGPR